MKKKLNLCVRYIFFLLYLTNLKNIEKTTKYFFQLFLFTQMILKFLNVSNFCCEKYINLCKVHMQMFINNTYVYQRRIQPWGIRGICPSCLKKVLMGGTGGRRQLVSFQGGNFLHPLGVILLLVKIFLPHLKIKSATDENKPGHVSDVYYTV